MRETMWKEFIPKSWILVRRMYTWALFKQDLLAGVTVGVVALPLAMAFAIASGVLPEQGLYTAIIAGFLISFFGGSRYQISGPTGAFVVILYGIIQSEGYGGLVAAGLLAGVLLIIASLLRLGSLIRYIPYPLVTGFTTGIAVVIFSSQVVDFLGLHVVSLPVGFLAKWRCIICSLPSWDFITTTVSLGTLILMLGIRRFAPKWPWGILAVSVMTLICFIWHLPVATIASRFGEITPGLPMPSFPSLTISSFSTLITNACTIAFLAGIESLLS
ncbi:MAG: sodium-independent anion transporter, partial [Chlamydiae bacterium]|nr:sodium-independent anion transporter [Chlamydiota bacterium]